MPRDDEREPVPPAGPAYRAFRDEGGADPKGRNPRPAHDAGRSVGERAGPSSPSACRCPRTARAVAVLGTSVEPRQAGSLAGLDPGETAASIEALLRAGVLEGERTLGFVHPLVRSAVYGDLSAPARSQRHRRAAQMLAGEHAPHDRIAPHLVESLPAADDWTVERLRLAAADAASRGAAEIAADYLRRALAEPPADGVCSRVLFELGQIEARQDPKAALPHLEEARAGADQSTLRAAATLALGEALTRVGRLREAVALLSEGIVEAGDGETSGHRWWRPCSVRPAGSLGPKLHGTRSSTS